MSQADPTEGRARQEAADWFARLNRRQVSLAEIEAFRAWRAEPSNRAAYEVVDRTWRRADALKDEPAINQSLTDALARGAVRRRRRERQGSWIAGAGVASLVCLSIAGGAWDYLLSHPSYATKVGEQRLVRRADGSSIRLDTDTRIDVAFRGGERDIRLERGQAFFDVTHDRTRPFLVAAGPTTVRAVGTKFDVRDDGGQTTVTLVEGVVEVRRRGVTPRMWTLQPGQQVASAAAAPKLVNIEAATGWTAGRVVFEGVPLGVAVQEINRYALHKILLQAPDAAATPVTGSFETGDSEAFVSAVSDLHGLRATREPDGTVVLAPAASGSP